MSPPTVHAYIHYPRRGRARPYLRRFVAHDGAAAPQLPWTVPALCAAYQWPAGTAPGGGVIAIVELGGGWNQADIDAFCASVNQPAPSVTDVSVDGTANTPGADPDADGEVALDIQVAAAAYFVATGQPATIRVYWAKDIAPAIRAATADGCDVCSISWGLDEAAWDPPSAQELEAAATAATASGMVVLAAAGDNDSGDQNPNAPKTSNPANADLPAACPHVIGCGGTTKTAASETVWNNNPGNPFGEGTGGGYSQIFTPLPGWQIGAPNGPGRMVPDLAANADPNTGYNVVVTGQNQVIGGTSAVAPLMAGLFASFGTKLGWITPTLWQHQTAFNDITEGDNGVYRAVRGPDACSGIGSPIGTRLAALFTNPAQAQAIRITGIQADNAMHRGQ